MSTPARLVGYEANNVPLKENKITNSKAIRNVRTCITHQFVGTFAHLVIKPVISTTQIYLLVKVVKITNHGINKIARCLPDISDKVGILIGNQLRGEQSDYILNDSQMTKCIPIVV